jgi:hypothetical protein
MDVISIYIDVQICMFSYILQLICLSTYFFEYKRNIYKKNYIYIIDASGTLRFRGFFENDAPDASLPKNAPASLRALATLITPPSQQGWTFCIMPSLSLKYSYFTLDKGLVRMSAIYSFVDMYWGSTAPLCTMSQM